MTIKPQTVLGKVTEGTEANSTLLLRVVEDLKPRFSRRARTKGMAHCEDDVNDYLQEAFIKVYPIVEDKHETFASYDDLLKYCTTVGYNAMTDRFRSQKSKTHGGRYRSGEAIEVKVFSLSPDGDDVGHDIPSPHNIESYIEQQHHKKVVAEIINIARKCNVERVDVVLDKYLNDVDPKILREMHTLSQEKLSLVDRRTRKVLVELAVEKGVNTHDLFE